MDLETSWENTCKVLFGDGIGGLDEYDAYLSRHVKLPASGKSSISGKDIAVSSAVQKGAKFISNDEMPEFEKNAGSTPFNINEIKDIDSAIGALGERFCYSGNIQLGNCAGISRSNKCIDAAFVNRSEYVYYSKYVSHSIMVRHSECVFGTVSTAEIKFGIKHFESWRSVRMLEAFRTYTSSDCYFVANVESCQNCLFSFNLRNQSNCIGNLKLEKEKFSALRDKLVADVRDTLRAKKSIPSIVDIVGDVS
ncbi:Uncharacterised protein [uncultured archaeon]|nr:Uncharacterised protein [uncultured archaeon]